MPKYAQYRSLFCDSSSSLQQIWKHKYNFFSNAAYRNIWSTQYALYQIILYYDRSHYNQFRIVPLAALSKGTVVLFIRRSQCSRTISHHTTKVASFFIQICIMIFNPFFSQKQIHMMMNINRFINHVRNDVIPHKTPWLLAFLTRK